MTRLPDWETRLRAVLAAARDRPFELGTWDCALFGGAVVQALTGEDIAAPFRGRYTTVRGYKRALTAQGHADIFGPFDAIAPRVAPLRCRRGDIVTDGQSIGIMWVRAALFVGGSREDGGTYHVGLVTVPPAAIQHGWAIG